MLFSFEQISPACRVPHLHDMEILVTTVCDSNLGWVGAMLGIRFRRHCFKIFFSRTIRSSGGKSVSVRHLLQCYQTKKEKSIVWDTYFYIRLIYLPHKLNLREGRVEGRPLILWHLTQKQNRLCSVQLDLLIWLIHLSTILKTVNVDRYFGSNPPDGSI